MNNFRKMRRINFALQGGGRRRSGLRRLTTTQSGRNLDKQISEVIYGQCLSKVFPAERAGRRETLMNLQSIIITNCIGAVIVFLTAFISTMTRQHRSTETSMYNAMLGICGSCCVLEMITFVIDGRWFPGFLLAAKLSNTGLYIASCSLSLIWCLYTDFHLYHSKERLKTRFAPLIVVTIAGLLVIIGNLFGEYLFAFDENHCYYRKPLSYVFFAIPIVYSLISVIDAYLYRKRRQKLILFPMWSFLGPFFFGLALQTLIYGISLAWCCAAIGMSTLYMTLLHQLIYQDPLTELFNRYYLNYILASSGWNNGRKRSGIMIDIDYFKTINDTCGHSAGDQALVDTACLIQENTPSDSIAIRFAGDEFIVLLTAESNDQIREVEEKLQSAVDVFNRTQGRPYHLSFSMGHSIFDPGKNTADDFLNKMDETMYENKRARHRSGEGSAH